MAIALASLVVLAGALVVAINTDPGRRIVARQINQLELASGLRIGIGRLEGSLYGDLTIRDLVLRDAKGVFLTSPVVRLDWRPFSYLRDHVDIRSAEAGTMRLLRLPELKPSGDPDAPLLPDLDIEIGRLRIARLIVEPPVAGRRHIVSISGSANIADGRARVSADAAALRVQGLAGGDRLRLRLDAVPDQDRLSLDARIAAPAGGLVAGIAGLEQPLTAVAQGRGSWANWRGAARARLGGQPLADLAITGRSGTFQIDGLTRPGLILEGPAARLTMPALQVAVTAALDDRRVDLRSRFRSASIDVAANGRIDLARNRFGDLRVEGRLLQPGALAPNVRGRDVRLSLLLDGAFATPLVDYDLSAAALAFDATTVEGLRAQGRARIDADRILIPISARALRITGLNAAAGGLLTNVRLDGNFAISGGRVLSDDLRIRSDKINATAVIVADLARGTYLAALQGRVNDYRIDGLGVVNLVTDIKIETAPAGGFGLRGTVQMRTRSLENASVREFLGGNADVVAGVAMSPEGAITLSGLRVTAPQLRITSGSGTYRPDGRYSFRAAGVSRRYGSFAADASGAADLASGRYVGRLSGRVNDARIDGLGVVDLVTAMTFESAGGGVALRGNVRARTKRLDNESVRDFLGGNADIAAGVAVNQQGVVTVSDLRATAPQLRVTSGGGTYAPDGRISFRAAGVSTQYGPFTAEIGGTASQPIVRLRASRPILGVQFSNVDARIVATANGYAITATGDSPYGPFFADVLVRSGRGPLSVDIRRARFAGVDFAGNLVQTAAGPFAGSLSLNGSGLDGRVQLAAAGRYQRAQFFVTANGARIPADPPVTIARGIIQGTAILYPNAPAITVDVQLNGVRRGDLSIDRSRARIRYQNGRGTAAVFAQGNSGVPFSIAAQASLSPNRILVNASGTANRIAFRLAGPADIRKIGAAWQLAPVTLVLPQGRARIAGRYGNGLALQARLQALDLSIVNVFSPGAGFGGKASGLISFTQPSPTASPTGEARINIDNFTRAGAAMVSRPVNVALLATLTPVGADARAVVRRGGAVIGRLQARMQPLGGGGSLTERLLAAPLAGGIRYNGPAELLWSLAGISDQQVSGPIGIAADFGGRVRAPQLNGVIRANALRYENETYGTTISNLALQGRFNSSRLEITQLQGRAGSGTVTGRGSIGLAAASGFPIDFRATFDRAQLARSDALGATVSGNIAVTNSAANGALVSGDLRIPEARYEVIRQGAAEVVELQGVRRRGEPVRPPLEQQAAAAPSIWKLDLRIRAENRLFVSGMGLESEWESDLRVGGTSSNPSVTGQMEIIRGTYSFAGRRLALDRGIIRFNGRRPIDPTLDISASTTVEGVTVAVNIGGRSQDPRVTFSSTPSLPQDEILSRLLFGNSITELSASQAIQLASALNSLRGGGGGLNPLGKLRSATGLDRLRILGADKTGGQGTAIAAGQYISNDIYIEVITDARGFTAVQLEVALSKSLSILSQVGSFAGTNVNVRYTKDY